MITLRDETPLARDIGARAYGFISLDKPAGPSSHEVTAWVKKILGASKAGHAGTLDPKVTGVLPIAIGRAVKVLRALATSDKEYICIARFERAPEDVAALFKKFTGRIHQVPPKESAVKRVRRQRTIYSLKLLEQDKGLILFKVHCQHGTYIRTLVKDMGKAVGSPAEMVELRRARAGPFLEQGCITLQDLKDFPEKGMLPVESAVAHLKKMVVGNNAVCAVCHGASLARSGVAALDEGIEAKQMVALMTVGGELIGLARATLASKAIASARKGIVAQPVCIVMERDAYPRKWKRG